jgi:hypothetical protein
MIRAMRTLLFVVAATAMAPLYAQTYKWVDDKGVVNYSNVPPPARMAKALPIEDRVSVITPDPKLAAATAAAQAQSARQAEYAHQEWLARQQGMLQAQALAAAYAAPADYGPYYPYAYGAARYVRSRPLPPRVVHNGQRRL